MKQVATILAIAAVVGFGLMALAQEGTSQPSAQALTGKIVSVDATGGKVVMAKINGQQVTIATDANTKVKVNDKDASLGDVKANMPVAVRPVTGTATEIRVYTPLSQPSK